MNLTSNPNTICPDQLPPHESRIPTGYCEFCGEETCCGMAWCDECNVQDCVQCGKSLPCEDMESGYCEDCLRIAAQDESIAIDYAQQDDISDNAQSIAEEVIYAMFGAESEDGENIYRKYEFLTAEIADAVKGIIGDIFPHARARESYWGLPNFRTVKRDYILKSIGKGLEAFCMDNPSNFAEWLTTGTKHEKWNGWGLV